MDELTVDTQNLLNSIRDWMGVSPDWAVKYIGLAGGLPAWVLLVFVLIAGGLTFGLYWRHASLSTGRKIALGLLRTLTYATILLILFRPVIGLEKRSTVKRNLLVLIDHSQSMAIKDPRNKPLELSDAALGLHKARFTLPEAQQALAGAQRVMADAVLALKQGEYDAAMKALAAAEDALAQATATPEDSQTQPAAGVTSQAGQFVKAIKTFQQRQKSIRLHAEKLETQGLLTKDQRASLAETQTALIADLDKLGTELADVPIAVPGTAVAGLAGVSRLELGYGLLTNPQLKFFQQFDQQFSTHCFLFGEKLLACEPNASDLLTQLGGDAFSTFGRAKGEPKPAGDTGPKAMSASSRGATAIQEAVSQYSGQAIAGVVLLTDGAFNDEGVDPQTVAASLNQQGVPLYIVGLGLEAPQDVGLRSLIVQDAFFPKDKVNVRVQVHSHGYEGIDGEVRLMLDDKEMDKKVVKLSDTPQFVQMSFEVPEGKGTTAKLSVEIAHKDGEISNENNRIERTVKIINEKIKVLYVEGKPRWEYRYLRVVLLRDPRMDVKFLMTRGDPALAEASPLYVPGFPDDAKEAFKYDMVILGDVPSWYFNRSQMERIVQLVRERGGSLLVLAGTRYNPASYVETPLADVMPVYITRDYVQVPEKTFPVVTDAGAKSFALLESPDAANAAVWSLVKPMYLIPRLDKDGAKPAANVMVEVPVAGSGGPRNAYPLVAWHYAGTGKVMYVGTDQLWRLRFKLGDHYHARFWGQAIQFLTLSRLLGENRRIRLEVDGDKLRAGQRVEIHVNVLDESFQPVKADTYKIECVRLAANGAATQPTTDAAGGIVLDTLPITVSPVKGTPGLFQGYVTLPQEGHWQLRAIAKDMRFSNSVDLTVEASNREQQEPAMQAALLKKMAQLSGGRYLPASRLPALPGLLEGTERTVIERKEEDLWDIWPTLAILILAAGLEWFFRRRYHLL